MDRIFTSQPRKMRPPGIFAVELRILPSAAAYSPVARHNKRINIAYVDGHVASYSGADVGCQTGDPHRDDIRWTIPDSTWAGPG